MDIRHLRSCDYIEPEGEFHCAFYATSGLDTVGLHDHDFFEFFFLLSGRVRHVAGGTSRVLGPGSLVLVRPQDAHRVEALPDQEFRFVNVAFPAETMASLAGYLHCPSWSAPVSTGAPASVRLYGADLRRLSESVERLNLLPHGDTEARRIQLRRLLVQVTEHLEAPSGCPGSVSSGSASGTSAVPARPPWLDGLLAEAAGREVFVEGTPALLRLSGRCHEHLCRVFALHVGRTPTEYVNDLRVNYAANLLTHSDLSVTAVALEAGFSSPAYFNRVFRSRFGESPSLLRRRSSGTLRAI